MILVYQHELNCQIFRHGVYKMNNQPINPHAPREECDRLALEGLIHGCGRPFIYRGAGDAVACDYI